MASRRLTVVTPTYFNSLKPIKKFIDSCCNLNLHFYCYGLYEPWPWLREAKVTSLRFELEKVKAEYILVSDSSDAFFLQGEDEIINRFENFKSKIVVSGEKNCWPQSLLQPYYPVDELDNSPWKFINTGGYMGRKEDIKSLLELMDSRHKLTCPPIGIHRTRDWNNDQFLMTLAYLQIDKKEFSIEIDTACEIFQTMGDTTRDEVRFHENKLRNIVTFSEPCVVHFNGHAQGIDEMYQQRFELWKELITTP